MKQVRAAPMAGDSHSDILSYRNKPEESYDVRRLKSIRSLLRKVRVGDWFARVPRTAQEAGEGFSCEPVGVERGTPQEPEAPGPRGQGSNGSRHRVHRH